VIAVVAQDPDLTSGYCLRRYVAARRLGSAQYVNSPAIDLLDEIDATLLAPCPLWAAVEVGAPPWKAFSRHRRTIYPERAIANLHSVTRDPHHALEQVIATRGAGRRRDLDDGPAKRARLASGHYQNVAHLDARAHRAGGNVDGMRDHRTERASKLSCHHRRCVKGHQPQGT
jgi:hypothetical protein